MEQCASPFCENPATDSFKKFAGPAITVNPDGAIIEYYLCRDHAKKLAREFDKKGIKYTTGPIQW